MFQGTFFKNPTIGFASDIAKNLQCYPTENSWFQKFTSSHTAAPIDSDTVKPVCNDHLYNKMYCLWLIQ